MIWWQFSSGRFVPREHTSKPLTHPATFHCIVLLQKCNIYYLYFVAVCHKQQKYIFATVQFQPTNQRWAIRQKVRRWRQNSFFSSRVCIQFLPSTTFSQCFKRSSVPGHRSQLPANERGESSLISNSVPARAQAGQSSKPAQCDGGWERAWTVFFLKQAGHVKLFPKR